jgi:anti-sigma B factor antagonist
MEIKVETKPEAVIAQVIGDLDGSTAPIALQQILAWIKPGGKMVLDMSQVGYMSSSGLRALLSIHRQITNNQGRLLLLGLAEELQDTMSTTGFLQYFTVCNTLAEALAALSS